MATSTTNDPLGEIGAPAVPALVAALTEKDEAVRTSAAQALGQIGVPAVEQLIAPLQTELARGLQMAHLQAVIAAIEILGQIGDARAVEPLIAALKDKDMRQTAAQALGQIGDTRAVEPLIAALEDEYVRRAAVVALGEIGDPRAVSPLVAALKDERAIVRESAAEGLKRLGWVPGKDEISALFHIALAELHRCVEIGVPAVKPLLDELDRQLREISRDRGTGAAYKVPSWHPQSHDMRARLDTLQRLAAKEREVRKVTAETLGQIGAPAVKPLIAGLKHESESAREATADALVYVGVPAVGPLVASLKCKGAPKIAVKTLDRLGWQPDRNQVGAIYWILQEQGDRCVQIGAPAVEPLIAALGDDDGSGRNAAARALGQIGDPRAVEPLVAALKDKEENVREAAAKALGQIGDPRAVEPLVAALGDTGVRLAAAKALGQIGDARGVEVLIAALNDKDGSERSSAAGALGQIGDARAVEPLVAALEDKDKYMRLAAANALVAIYASRSITEREAARILALRSTIVATAHTDQERHRDAGGSRNCHADEGMLHEDRGVVFPL